MTQSPQYILLGASMWEIFQDIVSGRQLWRDELARTRILATRKLTGLGKPTAL
jgi:hypothetical protein